MLTKRVPFAIEKVLAEPKGFRRHPSRDGIKCQATFAGGFGRFRATVIAHVENRRRNQKTSSRSFCDTFFLQKNIENHRLNL